MNSKVIFLLTLLSVFFISTPTFAQQEEITLSTYYPAPYGEYDELCAEKLLVWSPISSEFARMGLGDCHIGNSLIVGAGGTGFSYDELSAAANLPANGDVLIRGNVGIGTTEPDDKLQVAGNIRLHGPNGSYALILEPKGSLPGFLGNNVAIHKLGNEAAPWTGSMTSFAGFTPTTADLLLLGHVGVSIGTRSDGDKLTLRVTDQGKVGIGTTEPTQKLTIVQTNPTPAVGDLSITTNDGEQIQIIDSRPGGGNWRIGSSIGLIGQFGIVDGNAGVGGTDRLVIDTAGNVGIGTTSPGAKLEVAGDAKITGGLKPDYDSGWYADNAQTNHKTTLTHNLGVIPSRIQFWFSPDNPPSNWVYPVSVYGMSIYDDLSASLGYRTPEGIRVNTTTLEYLAFYRTYMYSYYDITTPETDPPSVRWVRWDTGYYRVQMWK